MACKYKIIIIDDEEFILKLLEKLLSNQEVRTAISIEEALSHLDAGFEPDIVITDYKLAGGTFGSEILEVARSRYPDAIRIVISGDPNSIPQSVSTNLAHRVLGKNTPPLENLINKIQQGDPI